MCTFSTLCEEMYISYEKFKEEKKNWSRLALIYYCLHVWMSLAMYVIQNYLKGSYLRPILFHPTYRSDTQLFLLSFVLSGIHTEKKQLPAAEQYNTKGLTD